jgi:predicted RNase H-like HicB family nuclease
VSRPKPKVELTVLYEPAENGWLTASVPSVPGTISIGRTRGEARESVLDALAEMLSTVPDEQSLNRSYTERIQVELSIGRVVGDDLDRAL